jgi:CHAT domain-containing protein
MTPDRACLSPEALAAFVAGNLSGKELDRAQKHVSSGCIECLLVMRDAAKVDRDGLSEIEKHAAPRFRSPWWLAAAAASVIGIIGLSVVMRPRDDLRTLVAAASTTSRKIEPRLGGFEYSPLVSTQRGEQPLDPGSMKLIGVAGSVLERTKNQHTAAVAQLLAGGTRGAVALLQRVAPRAESARVWSDLAAATYTDAVERGGDPARFTSALDAADHALRLDDRCPEALFNRALILERLGMDREACDAWERYLAIDTRSAWRREAQRHLCNMKSDASETSATELHAAAQKAASQQRWLEALDILALAIKSSPEDASLVLTRALIYARLGLHSLAEDDVARATLFVNRTHDVSLHQRVAVVRLEVEATFASSLEAVVQLMRGAPDSALPALYLHRARAFAAVGNVDGAFSDLENGLRHVRHTSWDGALTRNELFDTAVELALAAGDAQRAFMYAERARGGTASVAQTRGEVLIEYHVLPSQVAIFVVSDGHFTATRTRVQSNALRSEVEELTASATEPSRFRAAAARMYKQLLFPVENALKPGRTLVIVPDGPLQNVPFAALVAPTNRYVIEDHTVVVAQSATAYARIVPRQPTVPQNALVVTGPSGTDNLGRLAAAQREASVIAAAYPAAQRSILDETTFLSPLRRASVIHVAAHAIYDGRQSALVSQELDGMTGRLDASQIARMDLRDTNLVVLAACETAREENDGAQLSLADAFLEAGASNVIGTLWAIDDESASVFFPRLHARVAQGLAPAEALRLAQIDCIRKGDLPPLIWAAMQVTGRESTSSGAMTAARSSRMPSLVRVRWRS